MQKEIRAGVLTISDKGAKGLREDESGEIILQMLEESGLTVVKREIIPDDRQQIADTLIMWVDEDW